MTEIIQGEGITKIGNRTFEVTAGKINDFIKLVDQAGLEISVKGIKTGSTFHFTLTDPAVKRKWPFPALHAGANVFCTQHNPDDLIAKLAKEDLIFPKVFHLADTSYLVV